MPNCSRCDCCHAVDRRHAVARARRHVRAVGVEAAVAAHAAGDERLGDVVPGEQLGLGPRELDIAHRGECRSWRPTRPGAQNAGRDRRDAAADAGLDLGASARR